MHTFSDFGLLARLGFRAWGLGRYVNGPSSRRSQSAASIALPRAWCKYKRVRAHPVTTSANSAKTDVKFS